VLLQQCEVEVRFVHAHFWSNLQPIYQERVSRENTGEEERRMDNQQQFGLLKQGGSAWNEWRTKQPQASFCKHVWRTRAIVSRVLGKGVSNS
jgi:hypothetical protein